MEDVKNILLVTNSASDEEILLVKEAFTKAAQQGLKMRLSLVHVIPNLPTCYFNIPSMAQLAEQYYSEAKVSLTSCADLLGISKKDQWLITGRIKTEVLRLANKLDVQFILASSTSIQDLHKAFSFEKDTQTTQIKNINTLATASVIDC